MFLFKTNIKSENIIYYIFFLSVFCLTYYYSKYIVNTDDFLIHEFAHHIKNNKHLYKDIDYLVAPLSFYLLSEIHELPIFNGYIYRTIVSLLSLLNAIVFFVFLNSFDISKRYKKLIIITTICSNGLLIPSFWYGNLATLSVCIVILILRYEHKSLLYSMLLGFFSICTILFKQNIGISCTFGLIFSSIFIFKKEFFLFRFLGILSALAIFSIYFSTKTGLNFYDYFKIYLNYNIELVQQNSTRSLDFNFLVKNLFSNYFQYSSFNWNIFKIYFFFIFFLFIFKFFKKALIYKLFYLLTFISIFYFFFLNSHSSFAFLGNLYLFLIIFLLFFFLDKFSKNEIDNNHNILSCIIIILFSIAGALLKGPWGFNETFNLSFLLIVIIFYFFEKKNFFFLKNISIFILFSLFSFNITNLKNDIKVLNNLDFIKIDNKNVKGLLFPSKSFKNLEETIEFLIKHKINNFYLFPPEAPVYWLTDNINPTRVISSSKNVYPFGIKEIIQELQKAETLYILIKIDQVQNEGNSFFSDVEKKYFYDFVYDNYTRFYENNNYIFYKKNL